MEGHSLRRNIRSVKPQKVSFCREEMYKINLKTRFPRKYFNSTLIKPKPCGKECFREE